MLTWNGVPVMPTGEQLAGLGHPVLHFPRFCLEPVIDGQHLVGRVRPVGHLHS